MRARSVAAPPAQCAPRLLAAACALLALAAPSSRGDGGTEAPAVAVATAAELGAAVDAGTAHIVVTDHLDLSELPVFDYNGELTAPDDFTRVTVFDPPSLASIRVCHRYLQPVSERLSG